jgi:hypothetical protein
LAFVAVQRDQFVELAVGFDAFADDGHAEGVGHRGDGGDDFAVARSCT